MRLTSQMSIAAIGFTVQGIISRRGLRLEKDIRTSLNSLVLGQPAHMGGAAIFP